jgi:hypothetical protein
MALLVWDEKTYKIYVRCRTDEQFIPSEEVDKLVNEAEEISEEYSLLASRLTQLFDKCNRWNAKNDKIFAKNLTTQNTKSRFVKKS